MLLILGRVCWWDLMGQNLRLRTPVSSKLMKLHPCTLLVNLFDLLWKKLCNLIVVEVFGRVSKFWDTQTHNLCTCENISSNVCCMFCWSTFQWLKILEKQPYLSLKVMYIVHISEYLHIGISIPIPKYSMFAKPLCCVNLWGRVFKKPGLVRLKFFNMTHCFLWSVQQSRWIFHTPLE